MTVQRNKTPEINNEMWFSGNRQFREGILGKQWDNSLSLLMMLLTEVSLIF
jgi:hypothetical protein